MKSKEIDALVAARRARKHARREFDLRQRGLVAAKRHFVAGAAIDHIEQDARQPPSRKLAQRVDAVAAASQRGDVHPGVSR